MRISITQLRRIIKEEVEQTFLAEAADVEKIKTILQNQIEQIAAGQIADDAALKALIGRMTGNLLAMGRVSQKKKKKGELASDVQPLS